MRARGMEAGISLTRSWKHCRSSTQPAERRCACASAVFFFWIFFLILLTYSTSHPPITSVIRTYVC